MYTGDALCDFCILIMRWWANHSPFTYGEINVLLFIIIQLLLIALFVGTTIYNGFTKNTTRRKSIGIATIVMLAVLVITTVVLLLVPLLSGDLKLP